MSQVHRENKRNRRKKAKQKKNEKKYFSNDININEFSEKMIKDLASLKKIKEQLKEISMSYEEIESLENEAFNLLINKIELEKGNSKVEVGVIGSFSSGKSTFINSLFGEAVCPMNVKPTTSSITKFYYGDKIKIRMDGQEITEEEYQNHSQHLKGDSKNTETHYIEYAYPFERLSSIVLYDTPGFQNNFNDNDTKVTMKTLNSVDVIFFVIDISKGAIDKSSIERLQLPEFKNKRMYCILNKSDLKSPQAIEKIKNEITSERIFTEVIEYSASKVLEFGETNYITDSVQELEEQYIHTKSDFNINIKGMRTETKGRIKTKIEYKLHIDESEYLIDDSYINSKKQRARVEKMLNMISESKHDTLKHKLKVDIYDYNKKSLFIVKEMLDSLEKINFDEGYFDEFKRDIDQFREELYQFEKDNIEIFYQEWNDIFRRSCIVEDVENDEKDFWSTPYSKVYFKQDYFKEQIKKMDSLRVMHQLIEKWVVFFKKQYGFELEYIISEIELEIVEEALIWYLNFYNSDSYLLNTSKDSIYFEDKLEAREFIKDFSTFESKPSITKLHYFLEKHEEYIGFFKGYLSTQDDIKNHNITKLKQELNNFMKEKEDYVNSLQK